MLGKKIIGGFFCALLLTAGIAGDGATMEKTEIVMAANAREILCAAENEEEREELQLYADAAVLMDGKSGRVLYGKNANQPMAMASTTKIMTCILILEHVEDLDEKVSVSSYAASMPKVKLYIKKGEEYTVRDLLYSLMLESHNDSAVALAEHVGKNALGEDWKERQVSSFSVEESRMAVAAFTDLMNSKAVELGCVDTCYLTPNGLDATSVEEQRDGKCVELSHHTTAEELARIMAYCVSVSPKKEAFLAVTQKRTHSFACNGRSFSCSNHNGFLDMMEGVISGKTGFTNKAGYCYVGALESEGRTFVAVVLACGWPNNKNYKWSDTRELMEYGTEHYFYREVSAGEQAFPTIPVEHGQNSILGLPVSVSVKKASAVGKKEILMRSDEEVDVRFYCKSRMKAPVTEGSAAGIITYSVAGEVTRTEYLVAAKTVGEVDFRWCLGEILERFLF